MNGGFGVSLTEMMTDARSNTSAERMTHASMGSITMQGLTNYF